MNWRLNFDVPVTYAIEPGYQRAVYCSDFRGQDLDQAVNGVWRDPVTGLLLLQPSFLSRDFAADFKDISHFTLQPDFWQPSSRAVLTDGSSAPMLTNVFPQGASHTLIELLVEIAVIAILVDAGVDEMVWALQSTFTLGADEAICIHYHGLADEMLRYSNWFEIQWDNICLHISQTGICRVYLYDRASLTTAPTLVEQFEFAHPGDLVGSHGYFYLQPIPGYGLLFHHSRQTPKVDVFASNSNTGASFGHLIPWPTHLYTPAPSVSVLFEPSLVTIGVNPHMPHLLGYQSVTFPTGFAAGTFADSPFDPCYTPSHAPVTTRPLILTTAQTLGGTPVCNAGGQLRTPDNSALWAVGDRQGRVQIELSTTDARYTPFVAGYFVAWEPVTATRDTTATPPSKLLRLEFSEDEYARWEGTAEVVMETAAQRVIAERGDTTFLLEMSADGGATWTTVNGGIAKFTDLEALYAPRPGESTGPEPVATDSGFYYHCSATLCDNNERFREIFDMLDTAFDGEGLVDAFNSVLYANGFGVLASYESDIPPITLPPVGTGQTWQISPREGESSEQILQTFLLFLRRQYVEYRLRFDWGVQAWRLEYKPPCPNLTPIDPDGSGGFFDLKPSSDAEIWTLTAFGDEHDVAAQTVRYMTLHVMPEPPEANVTHVYGTTSNVPGAERVVSAPAVNFPSLNNPSSVDYLGRVKNAGFKAVGITDQGEIDKMNRRLFDAIGHRRMKGKVDAQDYVDGMKPNTYVNVRALDAGGNRATIFSTWVKKRTVVVENEDQETVTYTLDTNWVGEIQQ